MRVSTNKESNLPKYKTPEPTLLTHPCSPTWAYFRWFSRITKVHSFLNPATVTIAVSNLSLISKLQHLPHIHHSIPAQLLYFTRWVALGGSVAEWLACWTQAEGPAFKSQSRRCRVTVLGKLLTSICLCSPSSEIGSSPLKGFEGNCRPGGK